MILSCLGNRLVSGHMVQSYYIIVLCSMDKLLYVQTTSFLTELTIVVFIIPGLP